MRAERANVLSQQSNSPEESVLDHLLHRTVKTFLENSNIPFEGDVSLTAKDHRCKTALVHTGSATRSNFAPSLDHPAKSIIHRPQRVRKRSEKRMI
ncbi:hypothetical protein EVAR_99747_1 [Eumeta japonica]|uniref:Uncharacterized protein n=1 Tax=Eumeta variegata TaxID=151549 RepID=A0A4C2A817_EUMVA|nr:hypothetical protein EVAR_99747_1 [Eumeta japonica]